MTGLDVVAQLLSEGGNAAANLPSVRSPPAPKKKASEGNIKFVVVD